MFSIRETEVGKREREQLEKRSKSLRRHVLVSRVGLFFPPIRRDSSPRGFSSLCALYIRTRTPSPLLHLAASLSEHHFHVVGSVEIRKSRYLADFLQLPSLAAVRPSLSSPPAVCRFPSWRPKPSLRSFSLSLTSLRVLFLS